MLYTWTSVKIKMMITYASGLVNIDGAEIIDEKAHKVNFDFGFSAKNVKHSIKRANKGLL